MTKFFPVADVDAAARPRACGTSARTATRRRRRRWPSSRQRDAPRDLHLHFIGQLQSNKAAPVARYADVVQSVDRTKLVAALDRGAARRRSRRSQVARAGQPGRATRAAAGCGPQDVRRLADAVAAGVLPATCAASWPSRRSAPTPTQAFARLQEVADGIRARPPGGRLDLRRDERRPRGRGAPRRDTPACRDRNPRFAPVTSVISGEAVSRTHDDEPRRNDWEFAMAGALRKTMVYLGLSEEDQRHDAYDDYEAYDRARPRRTRHAREHHRRGDAAADQRTRSPPSCATSRSARSTASRRSTRAPTTRPRTSASGSATSCRSS